MWCVPLLWHHILYSALSSSHDINCDRMRLLWCVCLSTLAVQTFCSCTAGTDRQTDGSPTDIRTDGHKLFPLTALKLQVLYWNGDNNINRWSLKFSINVLFQAEVCVNKVLMIYCQCTAVFWLHNFLIHKVSTILLKLHDLGSSICFKHDCESECLTSSSLNQDRLSAVRINQYPLAPPFMKPMLLMVSQPLRMTCTTAKGKEVR